MIRERNWKYLLVDALIYLVLGLLLLTCVLPFVHEVALSLSSRPAVSASQVTLWPVDLNWDNYLAVVGKARFTHALLISLLRLLVAVPATLLASAMVAYPIDPVFIGLDVRYNVVLGLTDGSGAMASATAGMQF